MPQVKLTRAFDYYKAGERMTSYPKGYEGDMPQAHYDLAAASGAVDGVEAEDEVDPATASAEELVAAFNQQQLVEHAKAAGVATLSGTKAELAERIVASRG